jgi:hypothetical protein
VIDSIIIPMWLHPTVGAIVLVATLASSVWFGQLAIRGRFAGPGGKALLIITQVALMVQALIGIKLLDQGLGVVQLYIHYLGGLAPLAFFLVTYWFPSKSVLSQTRNQAIASVGAFSFALMTFGIGQMYAARALA